MLRCLWKFVLEFWSERTYQSSSEEFSLSVSKSSSFVLHGVSTCSQPLCTTHLSRLSHFISVQGRYFIWSCVDPKWTLFQMPLRPQGKAVYKLGEDQILTGEDYHERRCSRECPCFHTSFGSDVLTVIFF